MPVSRYETDLGDDDRRVYPLHQINIYCRPRYVIGPDYSGLFLCLVSKCIRFVVTQSTICYGM